MCRAYIWEPVCNDKPFQCDDCEWKVIHYSIIIYFKLSYIRCILYNWTRHGIIQAYMTHLPQDVVKYIGGTF